MNPSTFAPPVLVTGATGYVGGRLVPLLLERGWRVRAVARSMSKLRSRPWATHPECQLVQADMLDPQSLNLALNGCKTAFYLVHSMNPAVTDFAKADHQAAKNFAAACDIARVEGIIYLGGLGEDLPGLSHHLRSRLEVAGILRSSRALVTYLRAAIILGSGSASFEILRSLVERLPVMLAPAWVRTRCQPISIRNVLGYLAGCLEHPETAGQTYDIGGPDIVSYDELFQIYAQVAGLHRRIIIPLPFLSPGLSKMWLRLITPVSPSLVAPLIEGLKNEVICRDTRIQAIIPQQLLGCRETFQAARRALEDRLVPTCWADAGSTKVPEWLVCGDAPGSGGQLYEMGYTATIAASPQTVWPALEAIGGEQGWYFADLLWKLRGLIDRIMGGVGLGPGRKHPHCLLHGDALDCWRVHEARAPEKLSLVAAMKSPGEAALEFTLRPVHQGTQITLHARFAPTGLWGILYWQGMLLPHRLLFKGLLRGLARSLGAPLTEPPRRFTPAVPDACARMESGKQESLRRPGGQGPPEPPV